MNMPPPRSGGGGGGGGGDHPASGSGRGRHRIMSSWMTSREASSSEAGAPPGLRHPDRAVVASGRGHWDHPAGGARAEAAWGRAERDGRGGVPSEAGGGGGEGSYAYGGYEYDYAAQSWRQQPQRHPSSSQQPGNQDAWAGQDAAADPYGAYYYQQHHHHQQQGMAAQHQQPYGQTTAAGAGVVATSGGRLVAMPPAPPPPPPLPPSPPPGGEEHVGVAQYGSTYDPTYDPSIKQNEAFQRWWQSPKGAAPRQRPPEGVRWDSSGKYQDWETELAAQKQQHQQQRQQQQQTQQSQRRGQRRSHASRVDEAPSASVPDGRLDWEAPPRSEAEGGSGRRPDWTPPPPHQDDRRQQGQGHDRRADDSQQQQRKGAVLWKEDNKYQDWLSLLRARSEGASASNPIDLRGNEGSGDQPAAAAAAAARHPREERSPIDLTAEEPPEPPPPRRSASAPQPHTKPPASGKKKKKQKGGGGGGVQYEDAISALANLSRRWSGPSVVVEEAKATKKKVDARAEKRKREKLRKKEKKLKKKMMEAAAKAVLYGGKVVGGDDEDEEMDISEESDSDDDADKGRHLKTGADGSAKGKAVTVSDGSQREKQEKEEGEEEEEGQLSEEGHGQAEDAAMPPPRQEDKEASVRQEAEDSGVWAAKEQDEIEAIMAAAAAAAAEVSSLPTPTTAAENPLAPPSDLSGVAAAPASEVSAADKKTRLELELRRAALEKAKARLKAAMKKKREMAEKAASAASAGPKDAIATPGSSEPGPATEPSEAREALSALQSSNLMIQNIGTVGPDDRVRIMPEGYWISEDDEVDETQGTAEGPKDEAAETGTSGDAHATEELTPPGGQIQTSEAAVPWSEGGSSDSAAALPSPPPLPAPSQLNRKSSAQLKLELLKRKLALKQKERELMEKKKLLAAAAAAEGAGEGQPVGMAGPPALPLSAGEPAPLSDHVLGRSVVGEGQSNEPGGYHEAGPAEEAAKSPADDAVAADGVATGPSLLDPPSPLISRGSPQADREIAAVTIESKEGEIEGRQPIGLKLTTPVKSASAEVASTVPDNDTRKVDKRPTAAPVNIETLRKRQRELKHKNEVTNLTNLIEKQRKLLSVQGTKLEDCKAALERCAGSISAEEEALRNAEGHLEELVRRKRIMEGMVLAATRKLVGARKRLAEEKLRNAKRKKRKKNKPTSKGPPTGGRTLPEVNKSDTPGGVSSSVGPVGRSSQLRKRKATVAKASDFF